MEMSEDIVYANEDVRGKQSVSGDHFYNRGDNIYEDIYETPDTIKFNDFRNKTEDVTPRSRPGAKLSESEQPKKRPLRAAAVCLGLLSVLLLAGIIGLYLYYDRVYNNLTEDRDQLQTSYNNLIAERDQLQTSYNNLIAERDQLQTSYNNLTEERDQLQTSYNNLTEERDQLPRERDMLVWRAEGNGCPGGWRKFDSSCYFLSIVSKTWKESRRDCLNRGGDLVIIQSREEQDYIKTFMVMSWIGLTDEDREGLWTWVDNTQLTTAEYWHPGEPNGGREENCGMIWMNYDAWNDASCSAALPWICEKYAYR
ncbi:CD209 antigen-like protein 2 [Oncorhynchus mykiss]|uniref:CD209 antigen-like protein 2 n=1 Tax=Oncorhynchus mykiss TaxID=8022 RepID=UPI001878A4BC|nr:CD209 antigen-like protein 2 [Oncorhynchus mykiss]XP_036797746.1 CD209 antigen-like protein 2 [Oncorhynchus mykiss]XP_036797747.1 CD209 antigen-like protein 2 [Oncorhynchus mykiss]